MGSDDEEQQQQQQRHAEVFELKQQILERRDALLEEGPNKLVASCTFQHFWRATNGKDLFSCFELEGKVKDPVLAPIWDEFVAGVVEYAKQQGFSSSRRLVLTLAPGSGRSGGSGPFMHLLMDRIAHTLNEDEEFDLEVVVMEVKREGSLPAPMKTLTKIELKALYQAQSLRQLSLPEDFCVQEGDAFIPFNCLCHGITASTHAIFLHSEGVAEEQIKAFIFLTTGVSSLKRVDTWTLLLGARPSLKSAPDADLTEEELQLLAKIKEGEVAFEGKGWGKHLGLWSLGPHYGPLLTLRGLLAGPGVRAILGHLLVQQKTAAGLGELYAAVEEQQTANESPTKDDGSGLYLVLLKLEGDKELQQAFLQRARASLNETARYKIAPLIKARKDGDDDFVMLRMGQTGDLRGRCRQVFVSKPNTLKKRLARGGRTSLLAASVEEAFQETYADGNGNCARIFLPLVRRLDWCVDARLAEVEAELAFAGCAAQRDGVW